MLPSFIKALALGITFLSVSQNTLCARAGTLPRAVDVADYPSYQQPAMVVRADKEYLDWTVRVQVDKFALGGNTFNVLIFLGDVPSSPVQWRSTASYVGSVTAFASPSQNTGRPSLIEGFVHLNNFIVKHSGLHSFDSDVVKPYLKKNLSFRIQNSYDQAVNPNEASSVDISVASTTVTDSGDGTPEFGEAVYHDDLALAHAS